MQPCFRLLRQLQAVCGAARSFLGPSKSLKCVIDSDSNSKSSLVGSLQAYLLAAESDPTATTLLLDALDAQAPSPGSPGSVSAPGSGAAWLACLTGLLIGHALEVVEAGGLPYEAVRQGMLAAASEACKACLACVIPLAAVAGACDERGLLFYHNEVQALVGDGMEARVGGGGSVGEQGAEGEPSGSRAHRSDGTGADAADELGASAAPGVGQSAATGLALVGTARGAAAATGAVLRQPGAVNGHLGRPISQQQQQRTAGQVPISATALLPSSMASVAAGDAAAERKDEGDEFDWFDDAYVDAVQRQTEEAAAAVAAAVGDAGAARHRLSSEGWAGGGSEWVGQRSPHGVSAPEAAGAAGVVVIGSLVPDSDDSSSTSGGDSGEGGADGDNPHAATTRGVGLATTWGFDSRAAARWSNGGGLSSRPLPGAAALAAHDGKTQCGAGATASTRSLDQRDQQGIWVGALGSGISAGDTDVAEGREHKKEGFEEMEGGDEVDAERALRELEEEVGWFFGEDELAAEREAREWQRRMAAGAQGRPEGLSQERSSIASSRGGAGDGSLAGGSLGGQGQAGSPPVLARAAVERPGDAREWGSGDQHEPRTSGTVNGRARQQDALGGAWWGQRHELAAPSTSAGAASVAAAATPSPPVSLLRQTPLPLPPSQLSQLPAQRALSVQPPAAAPAAVLDPAQPRAPPPAPPRLDALSRLVCAAARGLAHGRHHEMQLAAAAALLLLRPLLQPAPFHTPRSDTQAPSHPATRASAPSRSQPATLPPDTPERAAAQPPSRQQAPPWPGPGPTSWAAQPTAAAPVAAPSKSVAPPAVEVSAAEAAASAEELAAVAARVRTAAAALQYERCVLTQELSGRPPEAAACVVRGAAVPLSALSMQQAELLEDFLASQRRGGPAEPATAGLPEALEAQATQVTAIFLLAALQHDHAAYGPVVVTAAADLAAATSDARAAAAADRILSHLKPCRATAAAPVPVLLLASGHVPDAVAGGVYDRSGGSVLVLGGLGTRTVRAAAAAAGVAPAASLAFLSPERSVARRVRLWLAAGGLGLADYRPTVTVAAAGRAGRRLRHTQPDALLLVEGGSGFGVEGETQRWRDEEARPGYRPGWVTVVLAARLTSELETRAAAFKACFCRLLSALQRGEALPGAGAWEVAAAQHLQRRADEQEAALGAALSPGSGCSSGSSGGGGGGGNTACDQGTGAHSPSGYEPDPFKLHRPAAYRVVAAALEDVVTCVLQNGGMPYGAAAAAVAAAGHALRRGDAEALRARAGRARRWLAHGVGRHSEQLRGADGCGSVARWRQLEEEQRQGGGRVAELSAVQAAGQGLEEGEEEAQLTEALFALMEMRGAGGGGLCLMGGARERRLRGLVLDEVGARKAGLKSAARLALLAGSIDSVIVNR